MKKNKTIPENIKSQKTEQDHTKTKENIKTTRQISEHSFKTIFN